MSLLEQAPVEPSPLLQNLVLFARLLRSVGIKVNSGQVIELATSLEWIDIGHKHDFRLAARALWVTRHEDLAMFDRAFDLFWQARGEVQSGPVPTAFAHLVQSEPPRNAGRRPPNAPRQGETRSRSSVPQLGRQAGASAQEDEAEEEPERLIVTVYSRQEAFRRKDFSRFSEEEVADARRFLDALRWTLTLRRSRRTRAAQRGRRLDLRRSLRASLRHGGEMLELAHRGPKLKRRQLVLICDISGSMERYTRLLLHFLYSVESSVRQAEVFVFGTRLTRITRELRNRNSDDALRSVAGHVQDWSGGTRIGESLRTFNREWARRVLGQGAIVLIISDGWDRGEPELLAAEMARLQRQSFRLVWLNPLLGSTEYRPVTQGIRAALPYVDDFLPVHNLESLESLADLLNRMQEGRPERRQFAGTGKEMDG